MMLIVLLVCEIFDLLDLVFVMSQVGDWCVLLGCVGVSVDIILVIVFFVGYVGLQVVGIMEKGCECCVEMCFVFVLVGQWWILVDGYGIDLWGCL